VVNQWRLVVPGAANPRPFRQIGHSVFSVCAGICGGVAAAWLYARIGTAAAAAARMSRCRIWATDGHG
jgi:hypothetical protein